MNTGFGIVIGIGLWLIGVPIPAVWGILAGILRFVPYVGPLIGAALPMIFAAGLDPGWTMVLYVALLFVITEPLLGYVIEPLLYGHSTGLSPIAVILAAVFWTWIWGPVGLILSMPLTLCLVVLGRHVPSLQFFDVLLGDRPPLTPVERFYQRILADDPDEALEQATALLKDRSLTAYYDEVVLAALKLAAEDARRGAIDHVRATRMVDQMLSLVDDLAGEDDEAPSSTSGAEGVDAITPVPTKEASAIAETAAPHLAEAPEDWRGDGSILCVAGRGVLDDAVTAMLEQLLEKRGFGVRRVPNGKVDRTAIRHLDLTGTKLICLSYLEIGGSPAHLRNLVQRLKRASGLPLLVGLWPEGEAALSESEIQRALGADIYVGSLSDAVESCLKQAQVA